MSDAASMLVGSSAVMEEVRSLVRQAALSVEPVLLVGEPGTGKRLAARAIHALSARSAAPFVSITCGEMSEGLLESELFGCEMHDCWGGTGTRHKPGRLAQAEGGTLLFDQLSESSPASQLSLLRFIQEKAYSRLGGTERVRANVRVMATTYRSLPEMVKAGTFREDLYASLSAVQIGLPRLCDRPGDLELLVGHFLANRPAQGHQNASVTPGALGLLAARMWHDNIQSLKEFIERKVLTAPAGDIVIDEVAVEMEPPPGAPPVRPTREARMEALRQTVDAALTKARGNRTKAARRLGVSRRTLYNWIEELGLEDARSVEAVHRWRSRHA